ncbi:hypothetical protein C0991_006194 [Blastosporella zonata]|nr:hypothetical protein C0991_006194 [Blastosporella zonata]
MAVLAPRDWQQQQVYQATMDGNSTNARQRSLPANPDGQHQHPQQQQQHHQQAFSYPVQQPQGSWTPSIAAAPFYPSFYQNHQQQQQQQPYPVQIPQQQPYFDPANAQLAQWAYQQMMFNAQHGFPQQQQQQRNNDYFAQNQLAPNFNPFPSGTPPPHQNHRGGAADHQQQPGQQNQFNGFHPYRRPSRQPQAQSPDMTDRRQVASPPPPNPPYKRPEASGSSSSVNSAGSRQRTNSNQSGHSGQNTPSVNANGRGRNVSPGVPPNRNSPPPASSSISSSSGQLRVPHHKAGSSSSTNSARPSGITPSPASSTTTTTSATASSSPTITSAPNPRPVRPSPLSQGNFIANERRMSRDDSDPMLDPTPSASMMRSGGLKGRLRRALSFNAAQALKEEEASDDESIKASKLKAKTPAIISSAVGKSTGSSTTIPGSTDGVDDTSSTATVQTKKRGRAASLFNAKMNLSTDNISLSSTVSSASVMIRKLGSMGKLAKRNSLAGITSLFKDKDKKKKDKDGKKGTAKAEASEASVSHVTAELDRSSDWTVRADMNGLSPAAKLARQHTLKSNAEAAAKAKAAQEAAAASSASANSSGSSTQTNGVNGPAGVPTWDKNTATRQGSESPVKSGAMRVNEDGTRVLVEDDDDESDGGHFDGPQQTGQGFHADGWGEDDEDWDGEGDQDEDTTIRVGLEKTSLDDEGYVPHDDVEPWAINVRRSAERSRRPTKGILKYADSYDQHIYLSEAPNPNRVRSNSYNSHPGHTPELGPLARIPSPDPDHIDGLHKHPHSSHNTPPAPAPPSLPPLSFDIPMSMGSPATKDSSLPPTPTNASHNQNPLAPHPPEKSNAIFNHPALNSSAPALSTMTTTPVMLTHRSATAPSKRLIFDNNLSVYDTFPASVYDRRSEPATWSRLTPALAQRIKEELNSYKMEEMEVHAASRIQYVVIFASYLANG